ncbi:unnamed protein product [Malus baccata var. baccata]
MADSEGITVVDIPESSSVASMQKKLEEKRKEFKTTTTRSSKWMYKFPASLTGISPKAIEPEIVSIGPYHRGQAELSKFESYKWLFLDGLLTRTESELGEYIDAMIGLEEPTRSCYSDHDKLLSPLSVDDFVEMMVLDGCFIIELFRHVRNYIYDDHDENDRKDDPILSMLWLIPVLSRDLLKLENQLPFSVLQKLYEISMDHKNGEDPLFLLALKFFNISLPRPIEFLKSLSTLEGKHSLDLFHLSFRPTKPSPDDPSPKYRPSSEAIQCTTQLRSSGVEFKAYKPNSILEINFQNKVLQIPPITINDFTITFFINCMALEQCREYETRDVTFLCSDGIINTGFLQNDQNVGELFKKLGQKVSFKIRDCYLSQQFRDVEAYYSSHRATFIRNYFSKPWSFISVSYALILLVLTGGQVVMSIASYINDRRKN